MPFSDELIATQAILAILEDVLEIDSAKVFVDVPLKQQQEVLGLIEPLSIAAISLKLCYEYDTDFPCGAFSAEQTILEMAEVIATHRIPMMPGRAILESVRFVA